MALFLTLVLLIVGFGLANAVLPRPARARCVYLVNNLAKPFPTKRFQVNFNFQVQRVGRRDSGVSNRF